MYDTKTLNSYGNKPRIPSMAILPSKQDQYLRETFDLNSKELKQLEKGTFSLIEQQKRFNKENLNTAKRKLYARRLSILFLDSLRYFQVLSALALLFYDTKWWLNKKIWIVVSVYFFPLLAVYIYNYVKQKVKPDKELEFIGIPKINKETSIEDLIADNFSIFSAIFGILWTVYVLGIYGRPFLWIVVFGPVEILILGLAERFKNKKIKGLFIKKHYNKDDEFEKTVIKFRTEKPKKEKDWDEAIKEFNQWSKDRGTYLEPLPMGTTQVIFRPPKSKFKK